MNEVAIGQRGKDSVTGLVGTVTARCEYLDGRVSLRLEGVADGKPFEGWYESPRITEAE